MPTRCFFLRTDVGVNCCFVTRVDIRVDGSRHIEVSTYENGKRCGVPIELSLRRAHRLNRLIDEMLQALDARQDKSVN